MFKFNNNIQGLIRSVKLFNNSEESVISKIIYAKKNSNNLSESVIYPNEALKFEITTNFDNPLQSKKADDFPYEYPIVNPNSISYDGFKIKVRPFPLETSWHLEASSNILLMADQKSSKIGENTININVRPLQNEGYSLEYFKIVSDTNNIDPVVIPFFILTKTQNSLESLVTWNFDGSNPLADTKQNYIIKNYKNRFNTDENISDELGGVTSRCLHNTLYNVIKSLKINNEVYDRSKESDANGKFSFIHENKIAYFDKENPAVNDLGYSKAIDETPNANLKVLEVFESNANLFETQFPLSLSNKDTHGYTLAAFVKFREGGEIGFFNENNMTGSFGISWSWYTFYFKVPYSKKEIYSDNKILKLSRDSGQKWNHVALEISKDLDFKRDKYNKNTGFGFVEYTPSFSMFAKEIGDKPITLNRAKEYDANNKFAWIITNNPNSNPTIYKILFSNTEIITKEESIFFYKSTDETPIQNSRLNSAFIAWDFYDDKFNYHKSYIDNYPGNGKLSRFREHKVYINGVLCKIELGEVFRRGNDVYQFNDIAENFKIRLGTNNSNTRGVDGVDEVKLFQKELSVDEIRNEASLAGFEFNGNDPYSNGILSEEEEELTGDTRKKIPIYEIKIDSKYFKRSCNDDYNGKFCWKNGNEKYFTEFKVPTTFSSLFDSINSLVPLNKTIQEVREVDFNNIPLDGYMKPFIIDNEIIAVAVNFHNFFIDRAKEEFPEFDQLLYNSYSGKTPDWFFRFNCSANYADLLKEYLPRIVSDMDDQVKWTVNNENVTILGRFWGQAGTFSFNHFQYQNSKKENKYFVEYPSILGTQWGDYVHYVYIKLNTPMVKGNSYNIKWNENNVSINYDPDQFCSIIKVNQEGYLPWANKKYAYMGMWLGSAKAYVPKLNNLTFYIVPSSGERTENNAVFSKLMTQRCEFNSSSGIVSDFYSREKNEVGSPLNGENTFECDFSEFKSINKKFIIINGKKYYRDELSDIFLKSIKDRHNNEYIHDYEKDSCNRMAFVKDDIIVYCDMGYIRYWKDAENFMPNVNDKAYIFYDRDSYAFKIKSVSCKKIYAWSKERVLENDWGNEGDTVWTNEEETPVNAFKEPYVFPVNNVIPNRTTLTISSHGNELCNDITGEYQIYIPTIGWSHKFEISRRSWGRIFWVTSRGIFHQRSGCSKVKHPYTNWEYEDAAHMWTWEGNFPPYENEYSVENVWKILENGDPDLSSGTKEGINSNAFNLISDETSNPVKIRRDANGGWFDAADFDRRTMHISLIKNLAESYVRYPQNFEDNQLFIPESGNGIPDILSEAMWGAKIYRALQEEDGGIRGWIETKQHESDWPWKSNLKYYSSFKNKKVSLSYANAVSILARALKIASERAKTENAKKECLKWSIIYTDSASAAYEFGISTKINSSIFKYRGNLYKYEESESKEYKLSELISASASMYVLTKNIKYLSYLTMENINQYILNISSNDNAWAPSISYELGIDFKSEFPELSKIVNDFYIEKADLWMLKQEENTYRIFNWGPNDYWLPACGWGLCHPDGRSNILLYAWTLTKNEKYRDALVLAFDHICGCNGNGRTWVNGLGKIGYGRHLDHWFQRSAEMNDFYSSRPGISPYLYSNLINMNHQVVNSCLYLKADPDDRGSLGFTGIDIDIRGNYVKAAFPMDKECTNGIDVRSQIFKHCPLWRTSVFNNEAYDPPCWEYTMAETLQKAALVGCLIGKGFKFRSEYGQISPARSIYDEPNFINLP